MFDRCLHAGVCCVDADTASTPRPQESQSLLSSSSSRLFIGILLLFVGFWIPIGEQLRPVLETQELSCPSESMKTEMSKWVPGDILVPNYPDILAAFDPFQNCKVSPSQPAPVSHSQPAQECLADLDRQLAS